MFNKLIYKIIRKFFDPFVDLFIYRTQNIETIFTTIYKTNRWGNLESVSGSGSTLEFTKNIRKELPMIFNKFSIKSVLDAPCGDFNWMQHVLTSYKVEYIGADIAKPLIDRNNKHYSNFGKFINLDITKDQLPIVDLIIVRDCLFHLSEKNIHQFFINFLSSKIKYLLITTHVNTNNYFQNRNISDGDFRLIDLFSHPYNFPKNELYSFDDYVESSTPKKMILFSRESIADAINKSNLFQILNCNFIKKVLHIIPSLEIGGAQKILVDIISNLNSNTVKVTLLVFKISNSELEKKVIKSNIDFITLDINNIYSPFIVFKLLKYFKYYDIIHAHLFPALYWVAITGRFTRNKLIYTEHSTFNKRRNLLLFKLIEKYIYSSYSKIISVSSIVQSNLILWLNKKILSNRYIIIENGVKLQDFNQINFQNFTNNKIRILIVSRFNDSKDQETVLRSIPHLTTKNIEFVFVGDGPNRSYCEELTNSLNIKDKVHFIGTSIDIPLLISNSYIGIQSSNWEGFGITAIEFMAYGKPIIASKIDGLIDIVENAGILFEPKDFIQLAIIIDLLISDKDYYNDISNKCKIRSLQYDLKFTIDKHIDLYRNI